MYIIKGYPEFKEDVKEIWNDFIFKNNFEVFKVSNNSIELKNEKCILQLDLNVEERIQYYFQNPNTSKIIDYITLAIYIGIYPVEGDSVGEEEYPLTMDEWIDIYAKKDYRSICRVDLPIILKEIEENFQFVIDGDFSWEKNIDEWQAWYDMNLKPGVAYHYKELSYKHFLKASEKTS